MLRWNVYAGIEIAANWEGGKKGASKINNNSVIVLDFFPSHFSGSRGGARAMENKEGDKYCYS